MGFNRQHEKGKWDQVGQERALQPSQSPQNPSKIMYAPEIALSPKPKKKKKTCLLSYRNTKQKQNIQQGGNLWTATVQGT